MSIDLENLDIKELKKLRHDIEKAIDTYEQRQRAEARKELEEHAKALGFKLEELISDKSIKKIKKPVPAKYQHPENPSITWPGRGRKPKFVLEHLDNGGSLDDLLIK